MEAADGEAFPVQSRAASGATRVRHSPYAAFQGHRKNPEVEINDVLTQHFKHRKECQNPGQVAYAATHVRTTHLACLPQGPAPGSLSAYLNLVPWASIPTAPSHVPHPLPGCRCLQRSQVLSSARPPVHTDPQIHPGRLMVLCSRHWPQRPPFCALLAPPCPTLPLLSEGWARSCSIFTPCRFQW